MSFEWKKMGIQLPVLQTKAFEQLIERLYGKRHKGQHKYLHAVAFELLAGVADDVLKQRVHHLRGMEDGVYTGLTTQTKNSRASMEAPRGPRHGHR